MEGSHPNPENEPRHALGFTKERKQPSKEDQAEGSDLIEWTQPGPDSEPWPCSRVLRSNPSCPVANFQKHRNSSGFRLLMGGGFPQNKPEKAPVDKGLPKHKKCLIQSNGKSDSSEKKRPNRNCAHPAKGVPQRTNVTLLFKVAS